MTISYKFPITEFFKNQIFIAVQKYRKLFFMKSATSATKGGDLSQGCHEGFFFNSYDAEV